MPAPQNVSLDILRTLHRLHRQLTDLRDRKEQGPKRVRGAEANVAHREAELAKAQADLKKLRVSADQKQLQLKASEDKIKDLQRKLNTATSNREYQTLKDQIAADNMAGSVLSDEILEALEEVDQAQTKIKEMETALAVSRKKAETVRAEVQRQAPTLQGDIGRLEAELQQAESALPPTIRDVYQRVVRSRGEDALAMVENEFCGGCNQHVPVNVCAEILLGHPMFCRSCGRLLYVPEDKSPQQAVKE
jgi:predicted  nucleic acid-binding Zn-ribbon protein